jgi:hypothetical protein
VIASSNFESFYYVSPLIGTVDVEPDSFTVSGTLTLPALRLTGELVVDNPVEPPGEGGGTGFELRASLATALSTVSGLRGFIKRPSAAKRGNAWPRVTGLEHVAPGTWQTGWQVVILLPTDELAQDDWIMARLDDITDVLAPLVWIESIQIGESHDSPALLINCRE